MLNIETHLLQESFIDLYHILNIGVLKKIFKNCLLHIVYMDKTTSDYEPFVWSRNCPGAQSKNSNQQYVKMLS